MVELTFCGAAGTVTGSRFLIDDGKNRTLIDCGLFQGHKELRQRNWEAPPFDPAGLQSVVLTHAHIDHSGYLPRLVKHGFRGPVYCTPATADLLDLLLRDSAMIQEEDARYANEKGFSKHKPALPLYTVKDAEAAVRQIEVVDFDGWSSLGPGARFRHRHAGHIIGSGMVDVEVDREGGPLRLLFSGDVGRYDAPLVPDPSVPKPCDVLVIESTYGDRDHPETSVEGQLHDLLARVRKSEGTLLVPAFAVGRSQQLVYLLNEVMEAHPELRMPIHLDSPMAVDTTKIYRKYPEEHGLEDVNLRSGSSVLYGPGVYLHKTREDSMRLNDLKGPRVIVSSSGMLSGGRVLHHLKRLLPREENVIVLAGYQAPGTRGWRLRNGEERIRIHGRTIPVVAPWAEISGLSAHADRGQLLRWVKDLPPPTTTFVTHGDDEALDGLAKLLKSELGFHCEIPEHGQSYTL